MSSSYNYANLSYQRKQAQTNPDNSCGALNVNINKTNVYQTAPTLPQGPKKDIFIPDSLLTPEHAQQICPLAHFTPTPTFNCNNGLNTSDIQFLQFVRDHQLVNGKAPPPPPRPTHKTQAATGKVGQKQTKVSLFGEFPASFNPRSSPNMSHKEKVNNWIMEVPVYLVSKGQTNSGDIWHSGCYPAVIPITSGISDIYEEEEDAQFPNSVVIDNPLFVDQTDVLEFQARKITEFARRIYQLDQGENARAGEKFAHDNSRTGEFSSFEPDFYLTSFQNSYQEAFNSSNQPTKQGDLELEFVQGSNLNYDTPAYEKKFNRPGNF